MKENGFEYVDLGLPSNTMWATCNVGATKPEDKGLLFQFGRVDGYKYKDNINQFKTNDQITTSGKVYKKYEILDLEDDAAHVNMGGKWRMPVNDDLKELIDNTIYEVETINGVKGMMFTSKINGHQLFISFTQGYLYDGTWFNFERPYSYVWYSQVHDSDIDIAYRLYFRSYDNANVIGLDSCSTAFSVRGVFRK